MRYDRLWERLVEHLEELGGAGEVSSGIEVAVERPEGAARTVEIRMTPDDWDDFISTMHGTGDPRVTTIQAKVLATPSDRRYLVYDTYDWTPSETPQLPEDAFAPGQGEWVVDDGKGDVARFADFNERS